MKVTICITYRGVGDRAYRPAVKKIVEMATPPRQGEDFSIDWDWASMTVKSVTWSEDEVYVRVSAGSFFEELDAFEALLKEKGYG